MQKLYERIKKSSEQNFRHIKTKRKTLNLPKIMRPSGSCHCTLHVKNKIIILSFFIDHILKTPQSKT
jgi:hypothetical protein